MEKILVWDLETTNLRANQGYLLAFGFKWLHQSKAHVLKITDFKRDELWDDSRLLTNALPILLEADIWVTWYGRRFDAPFFDTRLLLNKMGVLDFLKPHVDLWETARYKMSFTSNRLETVCGSLPLDAGETKHWKVPIDNWTWVKAGCGDKASINKIAVRNREDCYLTEAAYYKMRSRIRNHPNISLLREFGKPRDILGCPSCGSSHTQSRGYYVTASNRFNKLQCMDCLKWFHKSYKAPIPT